MSDEYDHIRGMQPRNETDGSCIKEQFLVPDNMFGKIIGLCGEQIHSIQVETGCNVQLDHNINDSHHMICTLIGSVESVKAARIKIEEIINKYSNDSIQFGDCVAEITIPGLLVPLLIGKGGENIKKLEEQCGVKLHVTKDGPEKSIYDKPLRISGDSENVEIAKQMVTDFLARNETFAVPLDKCGLVIGKGGKTIRNIIQKSGAHVNKAREDPSYANEQIFIIRGNPKQIEHAKDLIRESITYSDESSLNKDIYTNNKDMSLGQDYSIFYWIVIGIIICFMWSFSNKS